MALCLATLLAGGALRTSADQYTDQISADQQKQAQINAEIARLSAEIAAAQEQEPKLQAIIDTLNGQISSTETQITSAQAELGQIAATLSATRARLAQARAELAAEKRQLSRELVVIYELQQQSTPIKNLLQSGDFNAFWTSVINGRRISDQESTLVSQVQAQAAEIQSDVDLIAAEQVQQQAVLAQLQSTQQQLSQERAVQQTALNDLVALQQRDAAAVAAWTAANNALNAQIAALQQEEQQALAAGGGSGHFSWPDSGPISQGFGCTQFTFEAYDAGCPPPHRFHSGIDIAGACGNDITAADAGIAYIQPYQSYGYGNYIIIVHGNGWQTLYGHMSAFAVGNGQSVHRGQRIGWEGSTGNSTGCHLHFGVNHDNSWVNPMDYLS